MVDALAGPPSVMIHTRSNSCSEPMIDRKIQIRIVGPSSGSTMWRVVFHGVAPSSRGRLPQLGRDACSPASSRMIPKPMYFQVITTNSV